MKIIFIGDVVGSGGRSAVKALAPELKREYNASMIFANIENAAAGNGVTAKCMKEFGDSADVYSVGDHVWDQKSFESEIVLFRNLIRPANLHKAQPGQGFVVVQNPAGGKAAFIALQGKIFMRESAYCPFETVDEIIKKLPGDVKNIFVDFHAEATSEKIAMGRFLDGRVTAVMGTHTHVQTNDAVILPGGTAYVSDVGMVGAKRSILGREVEPIVHKFSTGMPMRFPVVEKGEFLLCAAAVSFDYMTGRAQSIELINKSITI